MTLSEEAIGLSSELADELSAISHKDAMTYAVRYAALKDADYALPDGELINRFDRDKECDYLNSQIKTYMMRTGEAPHIEGVGTFRLQRRRVVSHNLAALKAEQPLWFESAIREGWLKVDMQAIPETEKAVLAGYRIEGETLALVIDREDR